jgi:SAM-dependent methyltransferase
MFEELLKTYEQLEPAGADTWNPLEHDIELWHRLRLYLELRQALRLIPKIPATIRVLDVGCGTGRSARALLEFGVRPANILGLDLRASAIEYAANVNPAITYRVVSSLESWPEPGQFDLCMQCTVFSSIRGHQPRTAVAENMVRAVAEGGYIFWWDLIRTNDFAGGDRLEPASLFGALRVVSERAVCLRPTLAEAIKPGVARRVCGLSLLQDRVGFPPTHFSALFQKPAHPGHTLRHTGQPRADGGLTP